MNLNQVKSKIQDAILRLGNIQQLQKMQASELRAELDGLRAALESIPGAPIRIIIKKIPVVQDDARKIRNLQAVKILTLLTGRFGKNEPIAQKDAAEFLEQHRETFTRQPNAWGLFMWYLRHLVDEGCVEVLGGEMDKRLKNREKIEERIKMLENSMSDHDERQRTAMVLALRWAIGAPSEETRNTRGSIWK